MQMKSAVILALIGNALALPQLIARDVDTITGALGKIQTALTTLDTTVKAFNGDQAQVAPLTAQASAVQQSITDGATAVMATDPIGAIDALSVQSSANDLITTIKTTVTDLTGKKPQFDQVGQSATVLMQLQNQKQAAGGLQTAITAQVPAAVQGQAQSIGQQISAALDTGIVAFGGQAGAA
ncbi:hypothetical protein K402DRAFT_35484 [Aulographum hederae CBS 113979]|uniref:Cell wall protein n=1 Tax=Aulographum hederae CBS 113979 TaxID=1176131 RepID=A0A6G1H4B3_9PEZI|nr:hypothetical protein K402DRAFT_35484 [Aulographum hederae CBS 113979]